MMLLYSRVDPASVGTINGVQGSIQTVFDMLSYILSIVLAQTNDFRYLVRLRLLIAVLDFDR